MTKQSARTTERKGSKPIGEGGGSTRSSRRLLWLVVGLAIALIAILVVVALSRNQRPTATTELPASTIAETIGNQPVDRRVMGDPNAPVFIQVWEDYQCPHCQSFNRALDDTIRELVAEGTVRHEFLNRFVINAESVTIGMAAECAADQNRFWEYHDAVFNEIVRNPRTYQPVTLKGLAAEIGLDQTTFDRCLDTREHYESLLREDAAASNRGINSTPTILINGQPYQGEFDPDQFRAAVEAAVQG